MSQQIEALTSQPYKYGFTTDIESEEFQKGLSEDVVRMISAKKNEPEFMLEFRLKAYRHWLKMTEPTWAHVSYPKIDYQAIQYYAEPKQKEKLGSMDEVDPELKRTFEKLGIPLTEQKKLANVAVDAIFDSVSVASRTGRGSLPPSPALRATPARTCRSCWETRTRRPRQMSVPVPRPAWGR